MNPELLKGNNVELGVLEVSGDGLDTLRPMSGNILKTPESLSFSELCGNSELRCTCQQLRVKTLMCVSVGIMSCEVVFGSRAGLGRPGSAHKPSAHKPRATFRRSCHFRVRVTLPFALLPWPTSPKKSKCLANYLARNHADERVMSKIALRSRRARRTTSLVFTILRTTPQRASTICRISIVPTRP
jgi:hypothetical protein